MAHEEEDSQIEGLLGDIPPVEYPKHLFDQRKAEFLDQASRMRGRKKPGCPLFGLMSLGMIGLVVWTIYLIVISL